MESPKLADSFTNLAEALDRLEEVVNLPPDPHGTVMDSTVKRFEFTYEIFWKTMKRLLEFVDIQAKNPRDVMKYTFQQEWIDNEALWLQMRDDRNTSSHEYNAHKIKDIYLRVKTIHYPELRKTYQLLVESYGQN